MKKLLILSCVAASAVGSMAHAATAVCTAANAAANGVPITASTDFVKVDFTPKCSANTHVKYSQTATQFGVGAGSLKGKNIFAGGTGGGGVKATGTTCATGCTATDITDAIVDAARDAS